MDNYIINEKLINIIEYNKDYDAFQRISNILETKNKNTEFKYVIETQTNTKFNEDEWVNVVNKIQFNSNCICTHRIENIYIIKHIPTKMKFIVGSECVKKTSEKLYNKMTKDKCKFCNEPILDKRTLHGRQEICSKNCLDLNTITIKFGKYVGKKVIEILPDKGYCNWFIKTITTCNNKKIIDLIKNNI